VYLNVQLLQVLMKSSWRHSLLPLRIVLVQDFIPLKGGVHHFILVYRICLFGRQELIALYDRVTHRIDQLNFVEPNEFNANLLKHPPTGTADVASGTQCDQLLAAKQAYPIDQNKMMHAALKWDEVLDKHNSQGEE
jgi:hypothetical protein